MRVLDGDDEDAAPPLRRQPRPRGWFEVFCCGTIVLAIFVLLVVIAATR